MDDKYSGMTVLERLFASGLIIQFDRSVKEKNVDRIKSILEEVNFTDPVAVDSVLVKFGLKA